MKIAAFACVASLSVFAQSVTVPMDLQGNVPIVELEIAKASGGMRNVRFVVDSGGGGFIVGSKVMADIGAKREGPVQEAEGERFQLLSGVRAYARGMELNLAGVNTVGFAEKEWILQRNDAEGLIPGKLLRKYHMIFDYPQRTLTFAKFGSVEPRGEKIKADIAPNNGFPRIEVEVGGQAYGVLLDTGASFTMISRVKIDEWLKANPTWRTATGATAFANTRAMYTPTYGYPSFPRICGRTSTFCGRTDPTP